ncbi:MAG: ribosome silencing factor [Bacteroidota bacterium]|jgi:ribosome-associated protein
MTPKTKAPAKKTATKTAKKAVKKTAKKTVKISDPSLLLRDAIVKGMQEKKAKDIVCIDLRNVKTAIADFFVVCHADSRTNTESIARSVDEIVHKELGEDPTHVEGKSNAEWILLDYSGVIAHIFLNEKREFFGLERLWADAEIEAVPSNY